MRFLEALGGSRDSREESVQGCVCDPLIPQGNQYRNLDQFFLNCHHVPTNFAKNRVSVPKKLNPNIIRLDFGSSDSRKKREKVDFQSRLWTLNLKNFPNRGAKGRRRGSGIFQIETAQWGSRRSHSDARQQLKTRTPQHSPQAQRAHAP